MEIDQIINQFDLPAEEYEIHQITAGHINKTYKIDYRNGQFYILQSVSTIAFSDVPLIMRNIERVEHHIKNNPKTDFPPNAVPTLIKTKKGHNYLNLGEAEYWRAFNYIDGVSLSKTENRNQAHEAGKLYGQFLSAISDLDPASIGVTIKNFHNVNYRLKQFGEALDSATENRKQLAKEEIEWVQKNKDNAMAWFNNMTGPNAVLRVAHYDTKLSNVLFNNEDQAIAVIDFDTLMPGYIAFDYGDSVRTICSTTGEDDKDIEATFYDISLLQSFTNGFVSSLDGIVDTKEMGTFPDAVCYMPFIMGLRMLTDFLNNDVYYATKYESHNLDRARNQFKLTESGKKLSDQILNIIN